MSSLVSWGPSSPASSRPGARAVRPPTLTHQARTRGLLASPAACAAFARLRRRLVRVVHGRSAPRRAEPTGPPGQAVEELEVGPPRTVPPVKCEIVILGCKGVI
jgi:hypothetical protein